MLATEVPYKYTAVNVLIITGVLQRKFFVPGVYSIDCKYKSEVLVNWEISWHREGSMLMLVLFSSMWLL